MYFNEKARAVLLRDGIEFMGRRAEYLQDPDCLESMMMACIAQGIATRDGIIRTLLKYVGHSYPHVAAVLDGNTGLDPKQHLWWVDENKVYHLHPVVRPPSPRKRKAKGATAFYDDEAF